MAQYGKKKGGRNTKKLEKKIKKGLTKHAALNEAAGAGSPEKPRGGRKGKPYGD